MARPPSDLLPERKAYTRRLGADAPTLAMLAKHAERYGSGCVVETAIELGYSFAKCAELQESCDRIDMARLRREHPRAPMPRLMDPSDRVGLLMGATDG